MRENTTMRTPTVSVIMPCYNAAGTLHASIASVMAQTFADLEVLVVDDGSSDDSVALASELATWDRRIRVVRQANGGPAAARNLGIELSRGAFLAFLDADDCWRPDLLARHLDQFREHPRCAASFARVRFFDPSLTQPGRVSAYSKRLALADVLGENPVCTTSNLIARREAFADVGGFDTALTHGEDQEWLARILALSRWEIRGLPDVLVHYRTSPEGLSADITRMLEGWIAMMRRVRDYAPEEAQATAAQATALFNRYLARRALRTGQPSACVQPLLRAWRASPLTLLTHQPARTALTVLGVLLILLPGNPARALLAR